MLETWDTCSPRCKRPHDSISKDALWCLELGLRSHVGGEAAYVGIR